ncbi:hypothetical protein EON80_29640, partial [bacterium]
MSSSSLRSAATAPIPYMVRGVASLTLALNLFAASHSALADPPLTDFAHLPNLQAPLQISTETAYEVEMTTTLTLPTSAKKISELRLWHALPTKRQWSGIGDGTPRGTAAQSISFAPDTGKQEQQLAQNSNHV